MRIASLRLSPCGTLPHTMLRSSVAQDEDGEEEMDDGLEDETEEEFDGDQTEPEY